MIRSLICFLLVVNSHASIENYFLSKEMTEICEKSGGFIQNNQIFRSRPRFSQVGDELFAIYQNYEKGGFDLTHFSPKEISTKNISLGRLRDIKVTKDFLWVAREFQIDQYDLVTQEKLAEYEIVPHEYQSKLSAIKAFDYKEGKLYSVHGLYGLSIFNTKTEEIETRHHLDIKKDGSMAVNITAGKDHLFIAMATSRPNGFTGLISLKDNLIVSKAQYNQRKWGVIYVAAQMTSHGDHVLLNNAGWAHLFSKKDLLNLSKVSPNWLAQQEREPQGTFHLKIEGEVALDQKAAYGCGSLSYRRNQEPVLKGKIFHQKF